MTLPRILSVVAGALICTGSAGVFLRSRTRRFKALFWLGIGVTMVFAAFRPNLIEYLGEDSTELRVRLLVALLSFIMLTVTLEAIRVGRMQERYACLWLVAGVLLLGGALIEELALVIPRLTGISVTATAFLVVFTFGLLLLFYLSVALSSLQVKLFQIARALALAEERLRRLEREPRRRGAGAGPDTAGHDA